MTRDDLPAQKPPVRRENGLRPLHGPLADRGVLPTYQTDVQVGRLSRALGQRGQVAGMDGAVGLCAAEVFEPDERLDAQFHADIHHLARRPVEPDRPVGLFEITLWDSRRGF